MGMSPDELLVDALHHVAHIEVPGFPGNVGVKGYLHQQVTQLLGQHRGVARVYGLQGLVGFLQQVALQRFVGLLPVPGTPAWGAQPSHDVHQRLKIGYLAVQFVFIHGPNYNQRRLCFNR